MIHNKTRFELENQAHSTCQVEILNVALFKRSLALGFRGLISRDLPLSIPQMWPITAFFHTVNSIGFLFELECVIQARSSGLTECSREVFGANISIGTRPPSPPPPPLIPLMSVRKCSRLQMSNPPLHYFGLLLSTLLPIW